jgi:hypothetical protein
LDATVDNAMNAIARHLLGFLITTLLVVTLASVAKAQCPAMPQLGSPTVNVQVLTPKLVYHHDVDLFGLPKVEKSAERPPQGSILLGLTKLADGIVVVPHYVALPRPGGIYCVWLKKVDASIGIPVMDVYVASEYEPGSCEYNVILNHENTHVRFNLETMNEWAPTIQAALTESANRLFPAVFYKDPKRDNAVAQYLFENAKSTFLLMQQEMAKRNASIDTPQNYRRENAKCNHWSRHGFKLDQTN